MVRALYKTSEIIFFAGIGLFSPPIKFPTALLIPAVSVSNLPFLFNPIKFMIVPIKPPDDDESSVKAPY